VVHRAAFSDEDARSFPRVFACHQGSVAAVFEHASLFEDGPAACGAMRFISRTVIGPFIGTIAVVQILKPPLSIDIDVAIQASSRFVMPSLPT
jgi:hypothetical protein